jgi:hypothetical protein
MLNGPAVIMLVFTIAAAAPFKYRLLLPFNAVIAELLKHSYRWVSPRQSV